MSAIHKYPRTAHIEGSGLQAGDEDVPVVPFRRLAGRFLIVEEKMDGANSAISFDGDGRLLLQSRGHFLTGGPRERQFAVFKSWAARYAGDLWALLGTRYVLYGEWLWAKHTLYYTELPHYFLEFDVLDTTNGAFLDTHRRRQLLAPAPFVVSVAVLHAGNIASMDALRGLVGPSRFIGSDREGRLRAACNESGLDAGQVLSETDISGLMEGLYIKVEEDGVVAERYKYVRPGFLQRVLESGSHWMDRPLLPNALAPGVSIF